MRVRIGNLSMTTHPIHMHGYDFKVTCTDGGWVPESARWPEVTIDVPVGAMRAFEFVADEPGDWAFHCHKSHHTMNAMGHEVKNFIGVQTARLSQGDPQAHARLHGDGFGRHGGDGRDGNADARQHAADDDRLWPVRSDRDGRHVLGGEGTRRVSTATITRTQAGTNIRRGTVAYEFKATGDRSAAPPRRRTHGQPTSKSQSSSRE